MDRSFILYLSLLRDNNCLCVKFILPMRVKFNISYHVYYKNMIANCKKKVTQNEIARLKLFFFHSQA